MDLGIAGRVCVVTGGSRGIGLATARLLRAEGAKVLLVARDPGRLAAAAEGLDGGDEEIATLPLDVTEPDAGEQMLGAALAAFDGIDVLVNNAGTARRRDVLEVPDEDWRRQYELNVMAPMRAMRMIAPVLAERGWGRIVNVCSTAAKRPSQTMPEYSVAKAAELSLSRLFADRFVADGVLINAIAPAAVADALWLEPGGLLDQHIAAGGGGDRETALAEVSAGKPNGRLASAEEVAATIVYLCSERASYVAGAAWSVDAGTVQVII
ncbi:MAG TPA: SDR family oxidoreductase [Solirubrobacterales bacterium]|nr:SDR family oxidoreductase [Solirubrobacterales bacterium]